MEFAVLGTDSDLVALVAAAVEAGHRIVWLGDVRAEDAASLRKHTSLAESRVNDWETLLDHATAGGVLVGRGTASEELRTEQLKRLAADAVPLLVVHPAGPSLLGYYEIDMVRRETRAILRHYNPLVNCPPVGELSDWVRAGHEQIGNVVQVTCTRYVAGGSRSEVLDGLARDAELLAAVAGDVHKVSAIGPRTVASNSTDAISPASYASLQVQMTTGGPATLRWSVVPTSRGSTGIELSLVGERGQIVWNERQNELRIGNEVSQLPACDTALAAIDDFVFAIEKPDIVTDDSKPITRSTWDRATRATEVVDAVELSLQKGRTIEVYKQQLTEQLAFRGTMAALGCGLLLLGMCVMIVAGIAGGADWVLQRPVMGNWPILVLAVLALFLLLQFVPWLAARQKARRLREDERRPGDA